MPRPDVEYLLEQEAFVRSLARNLMAGEADDIVQQTYLQALSPGAEAVHRPRPWLARVVRNIVSNRRRTDARRSDRERIAARLELVPSSDEFMEREQRRSILVHAVDGLPDHLRTVVIPSRVTQSVNVRFSDGRPVVGTELELIETIGGKITGDTVVRDFESGGWPSQNPGFLCSKSKTSDDGLADVLGFEGRSYVLRCKGDHKTALMPLNSLTGDLLEVMIPCG